MLSTGKLPNAGTGILSTCRDTGGGGGGGREGEMTFLQTEFLKTEMKQGLEVQSLFHDTDLGVYLSVPFLN